MEPISNVVKVSLANYLADLPLPNSVLGWFRIGCKSMFLKLCLLAKIFIYLVAWYANLTFLHDVLVRGWLKLIPFFSAIGGVSYVTYRFVVPKSVSIFVFRIKITKMCFESTYEWFHFSHATLKLRKTCLRLWIPLISRNLARKRHSVDAGDQVNFLTAMVLTAAIMWFLATMLDLSS